VEFKKWTREDTMLNQGKRQDLKVKTLQEGYVKLWTVAWDTLHMDNKRISVSIKNEMLNNDHWGDLG
jgi:hypothetical protein